MREYGLVFHLTNYRIVTDESCLIQSNPNGV